jgi:hypothetical protein
MGVSGKLVATFAEGNLALAEVHANADYPHTYFDVLGVEDGMAKLKSHWDGKEFALPIKRNKHREFVTLEQMSTFERIFGRGKPAEIRIIPMQGERF